MKSSQVKDTKRSQRHARVRAKICGTKERPRLNVYRSLKSIYAQLIDDIAGKTIVAAHDSELKNKKGKKEERAKEVGKLLAQKALDKKIKKVVFDRGGYKYQGRIKAVADGAREGGLEF